MQHTTEHTITQNKQDSLYLLTCTCGWQSAQITDPKFIAAISSRHLLSVEVWPFENQPSSKGWPS